jgi:hypothetical protein
MSRNVDLFNREVPDDFQRDLTRFLADVHDVTRARIFAENSYEEAHYLFPHARRVAAERGARELAIRYGIPARSIRFDNNGDFYTKIETERVCITISHVHDRKLPRNAMSRETLAEESQMSLFEVSAPPAGTKLYCIVVYGGFSDQSETPPFVDVVIPARNYLGIVDRIDLLSKFGDVAGGAAPTEDIPDFGGPTIRPQPNTEA